MSSVYHSTTAAFKSFVHIELNTTIEKDEILGDPGPKPQPTKWAGGVMEISISGEVVSSAAVRKLTETQFSGQGRTW